MTRSLRWLAACSSCSLPLAAAAQQQGLEIDIVGGNAAALPIAVVPMPYQGAGAAPETDVAAVIRADLNRSGQFRAPARARHRRAPDARQRGQLPDLARAASRTTSSSAACSTPAAAATASSTSCSTWPSRSACSASR